MLTMERHPLLDTIIAVIKQDQRSQNLKESTIECLAQEAINGDYLEDSLWLDQRLDILSKENAAFKAEELADITISEPCLVLTQEDLTKVIADHAKWMECILSPESFSVKGRAHLTGSNLSGMALDHQNLSCATLTSVNFEGASLRYSNFSRAKLEKANFRKADLTGAVFKKANMNGADLREAILDDACFDGVDMNSIILEGSKRSEVEY